MRTAAALRHLADGLLSVAWAPCCAACETVLPQPTAGVVCADCWRRVARITPPLCDACGAPLAVDPGGGGAAPCRHCLTGRARPRPVARCRAAGWYDGALRAIIQAFKYQGRQSPAAPLGAGLQPVAGSGCAAGSAARGHPASNQAHAPASHPGRRAATGERSGSVRADRAGLAPRSRDGSRQGHRRGRRRDDNRGDAGGLRAGAARGRGPRGIRPHGCSSRGLTAAAMAAATSGTGRSLSTRSQAGCCAWRR